MTAASIDRGALRVAGSTRPGVRATSRVRAAGLLSAAAGTVILMGSITGEALYPRLYTTHADTLSHLGGTEPPNSVALQPSATIFDATMLVAGVLILASAWLVLSSFRSRTAGVAMALLGVGVLGVGVFPLTNPTPHTLIALVAFYSAGIAAIASSRLTPGPLRYFSIALGLVSIVAITLGLFLSALPPVVALGEGGIERWNAYPALIWLVAFGGWLMSSGTAKDAAA